jgi:hypothetical protein
VGPWEQLPRPPANDVLRGPELGSAVWTGRELVIWPTITNSKGGPSATPPAPTTRTASGGARSHHPITPRRLAALVWAGDRLLVWGGIQNVRADKLAYPDDGAAYDPRSNRWQPLTKAPVPGRATASGVTRRLVG